MTKMKYISIWMVGCMLLSLGAKAQQVVKLDLQRTIEIANDSSLSAFRYQNLYLSYLQGEPFAESYAGSDSG